MATSKQIPSFDDIIQAGRKRAQNEKLASEIFGRGRKSTPLQDNSRKSAQPGSLASRVTPAGIGKRSTSASSFKQNKAPTRPAYTAAQKARANKIGTFIANEDASAQRVKPNNAKGISIRGISSGPFHVEASNFAPGTTSADIESALHSVTGGASEACLTSCRILTSSPTVIAELVFSDRAVAEQVVGAFNGQKADGRVLHLRVKEPPAMVSQKVATPTEPTGFQRNRSRVHVKAAPVVEDSAMEDMVEAAPSSQPDAYTSERATADQVRENRDAEPSVQDGAYGFEDPIESETAAPLDEPRESYRNGDRDDRDRVYDRERDRERDSHRRYGDRGGYSRGDDYRRPDNGYSGYDRRDDRRDTRPPPYNGSSGWGGRGSWRGGGDRYGGMYSDNMMRGGRLGRGRGYH